MRTPEQVAEECEKFANKRGLEESTYSGCICGVRSRDLEIAEALKHALPNTKLMTNKEVLMFEDIIRVIKVLEGQQ